MITCDNITFVVFTVCENGILIHSGLKVLPKGLRCSILPKIKAKMLTIRDGTAYVTYCIDQTLFCTGRQADYHWLWHFLCVDFLRFIALNAIWPHFLGIKLRFYPIFMLPKHAKQNQIDAIWLGKKLVEE